MKQPPITIKKTSKNNSKYDNEYYEVKLNGEIFERSQIRHIIEILDSMIAI